ncbi:DUF6448 family protein [Marinobacter pelagius]|uniref:Uncharacterized protein n=1 Tax=Marinobacter pelagius TaxID=379482 RepID=A0A1I4XS81_9GAMM|nr:DUF6448 family protein [Marinobacter pelagius]SFN28546.1 hypothetical protein SAMN04487961_2704 [Marinobacter pelagius]
MKTKLRKATFTASAAVLLGLMLAGNAQAHCDAMDGPVITEARAALDAGDVTPLLKWVPAEDEAEIRRVFADVRDIRGQSEKVRKIADKHLFATLVKVHRASEGAPFTGIKPAGNIDPGLKAADAALSNGEIDQLIANITRKIETGIRERYDQAHSSSASADQSVKEGRHFVTDYVDYIHYVEAVHGAAGAGKHGH